MYCYCIFCVTVKCGAVASAIRQRYGYEAFSPRIVQRKWIKGACFEEERPYLPGYVFVYAREPIEEFQEINRIDGVARWLGERGEGFRLQGDDRRFAEMLHDHGGVIGIMKVYQEGDRVRLADENMLGGFEAEIIRLDRRKGRAQLQYNFDGNCYKIWVGYELIGE